VVLAPTPERDEAPVGESEQRIAWLRLAAIPLVVSAESFPHPNDERTAFYIVVAVVTVYALAAFVWVYLRPVTRKFALAATAIDVAAITALAGLSGGAFSEARLTYFLIPIAVAFRFTPSLTAVAGAVTVASYATLAFAHPAAKLAHAQRFILIQIGYLTWLSLAAVLLSAVLERRTSRVAELSEVRRRLISEAGTAEERERRVLAEGLHDHAVQNLLSVRHDLEEAGESMSHPALARADTAVAETIAELREAIFELHPYVLEQAGLPAALRAVAQRAAQRGGFRLHFRLQQGPRCPNEDVVLGCARELLANAAQHAGAGNVTVSLARQNGEVVIGVRDDGCGFDTKILPQRLAEGHIGLQSQRERVENIGGRLEIRTAVAGGTDAEIRVPAA
jgi:two-component system NarL family sensor kinase